MSGRYDQRIIAVSKAIRSDLDEIKTLLAWTSDCLSAIELMVAEFNTGLRNA